MPLAAAWEGLADMEKVDQSIWNWLQHTDFEGKGVTIAELIEKCGSERRMFACYWRGQMTEFVERFIEDKYPPDRIMGMKPLA